MKRKNSPKPVKQAEPAPAVSKMVLPTPEVQPIEQKTIPPQDGAKCLGTAEKPVSKALAIHDLKVSQADGIVTLKGYANTKGQADRYGDIPTVFPALRSYVYELSTFRKNPVMLIDHMNSVENIAGSFKVLREDEVGLYFEAEFSQSALPRVAHARQVYAEGHGKALSIAGRWYFEDKDNPSHLTYADIFEISLVGVGADPNALAAVAQEEPPKHAPDQSEFNAQEFSDALGQLVKKVEGIGQAAELAAELKRLGELVSSAIKKEA